MEYPLRVISCAKGMKRKILFPLIRGIACSRVSLSKDSDGGRDLRQANIWTKSFPGIVTFGRGQSGLAGLQPVQQPAGKRMGT